MYSTWTGVDSVDAVAEFMQDFVDQSAFLKYFKLRWVPKIGNDNVSTHCFRFFIVLIEAVLNTAAAVFHVFSCHRDVACYNEDSPTYKSGNMWCF
jgi:hypothetical protein